MPPGGPGTGTGAAGRGYWPGGIARGCAGSTPTRRQPAGSAAWNRVTSYGTHW